MKRPALILFTSALLLASCSLTTPRDTGKAHMVTLSPLEDPGFTCKAPLKGGVRVAYPLIPDDLDTYRIAILDKDDRRDYLAHIRWSEFLPSAVQAALVRSLNDSGASDDAFADGEVVAARWEMTTEITRFEVDYDDGGHPAHAAVGMQVTLRKNGDATTVKHFTLSQSVDIEANHAGPIIEALRESFDAIQVALLKKVAGCS